MLHRIQQLQDDSVRLDCEYFKIPYCEKARESFGRLHNAQFVGSVGVQIWDWRSFYALRDAKHLHADGGGGMILPIYLNDGKDKAGLFNFAITTPSPFGKIMNCVLYEDVNTSRTAKTMTKNLTLFATEYNWFFKKDVVGNFQFDNDNTKWWHLDGCLATLAV